MLLIVTVIIIISVHSPLLGSLLSPLYVLFHLILKITNKVITVANSHFIDES